MIHNNFHLGLAKNKTPTFIKELLTKIKVPAKMSNFVLTVSEVTGLENNESGLKVVCFYPET